MEAQNKDLVDIHCIISLLDLEKMPVIRLDILLIGYLRSPGMDKWDRLVGKSIRVIYNEMDDIIAVGHIVHDDWFYPRVDFA